MKILDATCGFRGIWYQKNHPFVTFMDVRSGKYTIATEHIKERNKRNIEVKPDVVSEWKDAPFPDNYFDMVIFDPPHMIINETKKLSLFCQKYGYLCKDNYKQVLQDGIKKLFDVIKLMPYPPLFGSNTKKKGYNETFWIVFIKYRPEKPLLEG